MTNRAQIRRELRKHRSNLSPRELDHARISVAAHANKLLPLLNSRRVLSYVPLAGEISPRSVEALFTRAKIYKPRITHFDKGQMKFYSASGPAQQNKYGIVEPKGIGEPLPAQHLDVALIPLVAFDRAGNRLGMGAGFYDRAMAFRMNSASPSRRPVLVGLSHHFQEVNTLEAQAWDVPLDVIITDQEVIHVAR